MQATRVKFGRVLIAASVLAGVCLAGGRTAQATLGGDVGSVAANVQRLGGQSHVQKLAATVGGERHDLQLPSGMVVHEFVSPSGAVYAITWSGLRAPDLRELLGPYFAQLSRPEASARAGRLHRMTYTGSDFVIQASGHRGAFAGRVWVPSLVPAGFTIDTALEVSQ